MYYRYPTTELRQQSNNNNSCDPQQNGSPFHPISISICTLRHLYSVSNVDVLSIYTHSIMGCVSLRNHKVHLCYGLYMIYVLKKILVKCTPDAASSSFLHKARRFFIVFYGPGDIKTAHNIMGKLFSQKHPFFTHADLKKPLLN